MAYKTYLTTQDYAQRTASLKRQMASLECVLRTMLRRV